jgi:hypothetical protein
MHSPKSYEVWINQDMEWLAKCDVVLRLPGISSGADKETALAEELGIPVYDNIATLHTAIRLKYETS